MFLRHLFADLINIKIEKVIVKSCCRHCECGAVEKKGEIRMNYIVKDDNPDVGFSVSGGEVTDAEGQPIPTTLEITSTNPDVISMALNPDGKSGTVHFGAPGLGNFNVVEKDAAGNIVASNSDGFTVTTGDPASITPIVTSFDGLTPVDDGGSGAEG
jgi:hypothetical protein